MSMVSIISTLLQITKLLLRWAQDKKLINQGRRQELAALLRQNAAVIEAALEIDAQVDAIPDAELDNEIESDMGFRE